MPLALAQFPSGPWLLLWPSVVAAVLVLFACERACGTRGVPPKPLRLLTSYVLLLPGLVLGTAWVVPWLAGTNSKFAPATMFANTCYGGACALLSASYAWRSLRSGRTHAALVPAHAARLTAQARMAAASILLLCSLGLVAFYFAAIS